MCSGDDDHSGNGNYLGFNESELNDFSLGFIEDEPNEDNTRSTNEDGGFASSPSFQVVEEIKVNHGMFVSTRQAADTFFHQILPSQTVEVHLLNPATITQNNSYNVTHHRRRHNRSPSSSTSFRKLMGGLTSKFLRAWKEIVRSAIVCMVALLLMHRFHDIGEEDDVMSGSDGRMKNGFINASDHSSSLVIKEKATAANWCNNDCNYSTRMKAGRLVKGISDDDDERREKEERMVVNVRDGQDNYYILTLKKLGIALTISLALRTMWANTSSSSSSSV